MAPAAARSHTGRDPPRSAPPPIKPLRLAILLRAPAGHGGEARNRELREAAPMAPRLAALLFLLLASCARGAPGGGRLVFVLAGQSNMSGRGGVANNTWDGAVPPECRPHPSIQRLGAALRWEEAREPLHADIDVYAACGVGPGMAFANVVRRKTRATVGLVPCAVGNTRIEQWQKGAPLYEQMVRRARAAGGRLAALLWYQGESDTILKADAEAYRRRMEQMVLDLRADLASPRLPVVQVLLASGQGPYVDLVREGQVSVNLSNVGYVDAKGLQLSADHVHLTAAAEVEVGRMLAVAYARLVAR